MYKVNVERVVNLPRQKVFDILVEFGGLEKAIDIAKELAALPADKDVRRVVLPEPRPFLEKYFGRGSSEASAEQKAQAALLESLPRDVRRSFRFAAMLDQMQRGQAMLLMPFELNIK